MFTMTFDQPATPRPPTSTPGGLPIYYQHNILRQDLRRNPYTLFIFGDNTERVGLGGQARDMRHEPNAFGIATLWKPGAPFHESQYASATNAIMSDIENIEVYLHEFAMVCCPANGIGTGLARMMEYAPSIKRFLDMALYQRLGIINE